MSEVTTDNEETKAKKQKLDWRDKCMKEFDLKEVPESWKNRVPEGSQIAWERYYNFRMENKTDDDDEDEEEDEYDEDGEDGDIKTWKYNFNNLKEEILKDDKTWQADLVVGELNYEDIGKIRTAYLYPKVYSPYMIPHAIDLEHRYHYRARWSSVEFDCSWGYKLIDFEDFEQRTHNGIEHKSLCSYDLEDSEADLEVVKTPHLNVATVRLLRQFLFGTVKESKVEYCNDYDFLRLLFGSMGTVDFEALKGRAIGYKWSPTDKIFEKLKREGVVSGVYAPSTPWLEYAMRKAAGVLRPIDKHYKPPQKKRRRR